MSRMIAVVVLFAASAVTTGQLVSFRDPALKAAVEAQLHVTNPQAADMLKLVYLVAPEKGISDLTGLEYAVNLATRNLIANFISDLSPLSSLTRLATLDVSSNEVSNISPLASMPALSELS